MENIQKSMAHYHLPGLFEFYELYRVFLPLFREHREYFYDCATSVPSTAHRQTASGAGDVWGLGTMTPEKFWN